jgi:FkbM family methyltransferase
MSVIHKLLSTESEWNPKVMMGRAVTPLLPERALYFIKKHYYTYLLTHTPDDWMEGDAAGVQFFISPGDDVLDIGANLGIFSRLLARLVGQKGHVYAFEPIPQTFGFLCHNLGKLKLRQVEPLPFALSDADRVDVMVIPTYRWGSECWYDARIKTSHPKKVNPKWREIEVHCKTLDSFHLPRISFIKCDANYHELAVLRGGAELIRKYRPAMLIEVNPNPDDPTTTAHETFALLAAEGYRAYCFREGKMLPRQPGQRSQNYFFLTPEHLDCHLRRSSVPA